MGMRENVLRLTRAVKGMALAGRPAKIWVRVTEIDGVCIEAGENTQIVMLDGASVYVKERPDEVLKQCEALGHPVGRFDRTGVREAKNDCLK